ncbi:hypothetical protein C8A05DRAFT_31778 [Staphylotrichum tortipilum]|uniref:SET domain-containing protein n=1 Tax=Staphylotrichum tortipilum TaxID=2831512 RepID=A0AAN6MQ79_9PEZI|nr:hypothetical protein C8A05DRAFT_31778 [Staphylotrichum longicolle]
MKRHDKTRFEALLAWSRHHGAELHPDLEIYCDDTTKFSLRVAPDAPHGVDCGFTAVTCPLATTLSYLNALVDAPITLPSPCQPSAAFPTRFMQTVPPHVIGRFFLVKEYLRGKDSFWAPYIATLPQPEHLDAWALPAFWPDDDIEFLEGTNAHVAAEEMQDNVRREFKQARRCLKEDDFPDWQDYTQMLYKWAFCIFTSRSFRPSLILSAATKQHVSPLLPPGCQADDFSILQPLFDIANHSMTAQYAWDVTTSPHACRLVCRDPYQPGEQVFNNYGTKTNSELLLAYGFLLPPTPALHNDYVHVRKRQEQGSPNDNKPKDFLISLRPASHASSLATRARVAMAPHSRLSFLPCFTHFEPALIDDLTAAVATPEQRAVLAEWEGQDSGLMGYGGAQPEEVAALVETVRGMLGGKLRYDLGRLGESGELVPVNRNQALAAEYRERCGRVLEEALGWLERGEAV